MQKPDTAAAAECHIPGSKVCRSHLPQKAGHAHEELVSSRAASYLSTGNRWGRESNRVTFGEQATRSQASDPVRKLPR